MRGFLSGVRFAGKGHGGNNQEAEGPKFQKLPELFNLQDAPIGHQKKSSTEQELMIANCQLRKFGFRTTL